MSTALLTVTECARHLNVSECWVRRHLCSLPVVRLGRLVRIDGDRLQSSRVQNQESQLQFVTQSGEPLKQPKGEVMLQRKRWQRGAVYLRRGRQMSMWYGRWWEDSVTAEGKVLRRNRKVRLGTVQDIPTKNDAREALSRHMALSSKPKVGSSRVDLQACKLEYSIVSPK